MSRPDGTTAQQAVARVRVSREQCPLNAGHSDSSFAGGSEVLASGHLPGCGVDRGEATAKNSKVVAGGRSRVVRRNRRGPGRYKPAVTDEGAVYLSARVLKKESKMLRRIHSY